MMCWCDKVKGRSLKSVPTVIAAGGNATIPGNPDRVSLRVTGAAAAGDVAIIRSGTITGPVISVISSTTPNDEMNIESMGQMVTSQLSVDCSAANTDTTVWEAVLTEEPGSCREQAR